jgi:hypothetical protein
MSLHLQVDCYSGYKADERPLRFSFADKPGGQAFEVKEVLDQWYGVDYHCFRVLADDGNLYILRHQLPEDNWVLDSFRSVASSSSC